MTGRRTFTDDQKAAALALAETDGITVAARATGVSTSTIYDWRAQARRRAPAPPIGRPSLLEDGDPRVAALLEHLTTGVPVATACHLAGLSEGTYYRWMTRGDTAPPDNPDEHDPDTLYRKFREQALCALAKSEATMVQVLRDAATGNNGYDKDWRAAAEMLKRRYPDRWNVGYSKTEHSGQVDSRVETVTVETADERRQAAAALRDDLAAKRDAREQQTG